MNAAHDPHADPLTPYWREKVERAATLDPFGHLPALRTPAPAVLRSHGLTPRQRHYVELVEVRGLSPVAAAKAEGVTPANIYRALRIAKELEGVGA